MQQNPLENKIVACIGIGEDVAIGGLQALVSLLKMCRKLHATPISSSLFIPPEEIVFRNNQFSAFSKTVHQRLHHLGTDLVFKVHQDIVLDKIKT